MKEKKQEKTEEPKPADGGDSSKKHENQLKWVVVGMVAVLMVAVIAYLLVQDSKKFSYGGVNFEKMMQGQIQLYHGIIPLKDSSGNTAANYNLYLRNDPRNLGGIQVGKIQLMQNAVVSIDAAAERGCSDSGIAGANFFSFLKMAGVNARVGYFNETYAAERNASYVTCNDSQSQSVIIIKQGDENKISLVGKDCYEIQFRECEILKPTERFMIGMVASSKGIKI